MLGWLIYDKDGAKRNEWFIDHISSLAKNYNISLDLKIVSSVQDLFNLKLPNFAIIRSINTQITKFLTLNNVRCFNNEVTSLIANDKWQTYQLCKKLNIKVMPTEQIINGQSPSFDVPYVIKTVSGHGGSEVSIINNSYDFDLVAEKYKGKKIIAQKLCSTVGVDMRLYVLGGKIVNSVKRESLTDFRSNFSLGGNAVLYSHTQEQKQVVDTLYRELKFDFVGVDFISHNGEWVLNEIEDVVGTRMLYDCGDTKTVKAWIEYISKVVNAKS